METEKILRLIEDSRKEMDELNELNNRGGQYDYTEGFVDGAKMILHRIENMIIKGEE